MANTVETSELRAMLENLRMMRDLTERPKIRHRYNVVCDRLDVLISKIEKGE